MSTQVTSYIIGAHITSSDNVKCKTMLFELNELDFQNFKLQLTTCMVAKSLYEKYLQKELTFIEFIEEFVKNCWNEEYCWMKQMSNNDIKFALNFITKIQSYFDTDMWMDFKDISDFICEKKITTITAEYEEIPIVF